MDFNLYDILYQALSSWEDEWLEEDCAENEWNIDAVRKMVDGYLKEIVSKGVH